MALSEDQKAMLRLLAQREAGYEDIATLMGLNVDQVRTMVRDSMAGIGGPLSPDQTAMLRLLAQREEGYEDIAALMGLSVDQVRARVSESLAELGEPGARPSGVAESKARRPPEEPIPATPAARAPNQQAPIAKSEGGPPASPAEDAPNPRPRPLGKRSPSPQTRLRLPKDQRLLAVGVGGAVALILILILVLSGGSSNSSSTATNTTATAPTGGSNSSSTASTTATNARLTEALLAPVNGGSASGRALFGRIHKTPVLQVEARGLKPSPRGQSYTVWLYRSPKLVLRVGAVSVGKSGGIAAQFPIPTQLLAYVASGAFNQIDVSLTSDASYKAEVAKAKSEKRLPPYTGTDILRGSITGPAVKK